LNANACTFSTAILNNNSFSLTSSTKCRVSIGPSSRGYNASNKRLLTDVGVVLVPFDATVEKLGGCI
jgi:hypothetical protein